LAKARELTSKMAAKEARWAANYESLSSLSSGQQGQILELSACVRRLRLALASSQSKLRALEAIREAEAVDEGEARGQREEGGGKAERAMLALELRCSEVEGQLKEARGEAQDLRNRLALVIPAPAPEHASAPASASVSASAFASLQQEAAFLKDSLAQAKGREEEHDREVHALHHALAVKDALLKDQAETLLEVKARLTSRDGETAEEIRDLKAALETEAADLEACEAEVAELRLALEEAERQQELQGEVSERYQRLVAAMTSVSASVSFDGSMAGLEIHDRGSLSLSERSRD
jgi:chromosome segregation ATPase